MRDHSALFLVLVIAAGVILGLLVVRRLITTRDVVTLLLGVFLGYLLTKYVLPRHFLALQHHPSHKCPLYDGPLAQRVSTGRALDPVPCAPADILIRIRMSLDLFPLPPWRHA